MHGVAVDCPICHLLCHIDLLLLVLLQQCSVKSLQLLEVLLDQLIVPGILVERQMLLVAFWNTIRLVTFSLEDEQSYRVVSIWKDIDLLHLLVKHQMSVLDGLHVGPGIFCLGDNLKYKILQELGMMLLCKFTMTLKQWKLLMSKLCDQGFDVHVQCLVCVQGPILLLWKLQDVGVVRGTIIPRIAILHFVVDITVLLANLARGCPRKARMNKKLSIL